MPRITIRRAMLIIAVLAYGMFVGPMLLDAVWLGPKEISCGTPCPAKLRSVALALVGFRDENHRYPSGTYLDTSLPYDDRLSFYAELMPHLDNQDLYDQMEWDQPWNAGFNGKIAATTNKRLQCTDQDLVLGCPSPTAYVGIAGLGLDAPLLAATDPRAGVFGYDRVTTLAEISDGTANTMVVAETAIVSGCWLQGGPATVRGVDPARKPYLGPKCQFGGLHQGGAWVAMADGSVRWVKDSVAPAAFEGLSTIAGGERLPPNWGPASP